MAIPVIEPVAVVASYEAASLGEAIDQLLAACDASAVIERRAQRIVTTNQTFFVKTLPNQGPTPTGRARLEAEARSLAVLRQAVEDAQAELIVPRPWGLAIGPDRSALLLDGLDLSRGDDSRHYRRRFGSALATLHRAVRAARFGSFPDNFIGPTPQSSPEHDDWPVFFAEHRLQAMARRLPSGTIDQALLDVLCTDLGGLFDRAPPAALLHGDLWTGNTGMVAGHQPAIFDPASYYGDPETDLAMLEMFGEPGADFFSAYHEILPIDPGYRVRKQLYNLYHLLNHCLLFGGGYCRATRTAIPALLAELKA